MELTQTYSQRQTMQMGGQMLASLSILGMSTSDLSDYLAEQAQANPYLRYTPPRAFIARGGEAFDAVAAVASARPSLMAHVVDQIELAFTRPEDRMIALRFAEALEPTGWLGQAVEYIAVIARVGQPKAERVLARLQEFEPAGLFARTLSECLLIQAREADVLTWEVEMLIKHLDLLAAGRKAELAELCDYEIGDLPQILAQIKGLNPKPGLDFDHVPTPVFPPDLIARRGGRRLEGRAEPGHLAGDHRARRPAAERHRRQGGAGDAAQGAGGGARAGAGARAAGRHAPAHRRRAGRAPVRVSREWSGAAHAAHAR